MGVPTATVSETHRDRSAGLRRRWVSRSLNPSYGLHQLKRARPKNIERAKMDWAFGRRPR